MVSARVRSRVRERPPLLTYEKRHNVLQNGGGSQKGRKKNRKKKGKKKQRVVKQQAPRSVRSETVFFLLVASENVSAPSMFVAQHGWRFRNPS